MKKILATVTSALVLFFAIGGHYTDAFDSITFENHARGIGTSSTFNVGTDPNTILIVQVCNDTKGQPVTNVTWNGTVMTELDSSTFDGANGESQLWYVLNASGSHTISMTGGTGASNSQAAAYSNVAGIDAHKVTASTGQPASASITTVTNTAVSWAAFCGHVASTANASYVTNVPNNQLPASGSQIDSVAMIEMADSGSISPAGATTQSIGWSGGGSLSGNWNFYQVAMQPTGATPATSLFGVLTFFGWW